MTGDECDCVECLCGCGAPADLTDEFDQGWCRPCWDEHEQRRGEALDAQRLEGL